jgi:hypothetical protein
MRLRAFWGPRTTCGCCGAEANVRLSIPKGHAIELRRRLPAQVGVARADLDDLL